MFWCRSGVEWRQQCAPPTQPAVVMERGRESAPEGGHKHSCLPSDLMWDKELRYVTGGS